MDKLEAISALEDLLAEIKEKVEEAYEIVSEVASQGTIARAGSYWYPQMLVELDEDHMYVAGSMCTLRDTINEIAEGDEDEDE